MIILAIETSCDETAVSVVEFKNQRVKILAEVISSQIKLHSQYGGVVPALAAREHLKNFVPVLKRALKKSRDADLSRLRTRDKSRFYGVDYIAVTSGPGLIPALMIGVSAAKALAYAWQKPLVPIHHIEGHIYANWLKPKLEIGNWKLENKKQKAGNEKLKTRKLENTKFHILSSISQNYELWKPEFPVLCLIVSGGHTQLVLMRKDLDYKIIGQTKDDAAGEAFDKVAKLLGLGYPGGPIIEKMAKKGDKNKFKFPRPMINSKNFDFSFSGLKTAVLYKWKLENKNGTGRIDRTNGTNGTNGTDKTDRVKVDVAASFQQAVIDVLIAKTLAAAKKYKAKSILLGGGVAANKELRRQFKTSLYPLLAKEGKISISNIQYPVSKLSTDNATMIATAAYYHIINKRSIKSWRNVKADAGLRLK